MLNKIEVRKNLREKRHTIATEQRKAAAHSAAKIIALHSIFLSSQNIATYLARDDEFHSRPLIEEIWSAGKNCFLPVLSAEKEKFLDFVKFSKDDTLRPNRYKILEPEHKTIIMHAEELDLVFVPLVGFDLHGHRLGMGGGYYDRTFEFLLPKSFKAKKPLLIGLAYEMQQTDTLPRDAWDVTLDGVLTERRLLLF